MNVSEVTGKKSGDNMTLIENIRRDHGRCSGMNQTYGYDEGVKQDCSHIAQLPVSAEEKV